MWNRTSQNYWSFIDAKTGVKINLQRHVEYNNFTCYFENTTIGKCGLDALQAVERLLDAAVVNGRQWARTEREDWSKSLISAAKRAKRSAIPGLDSDWEF